MRWAWAKILTLAGAAIAAGGAALSAQGPAFVQAYLQRLGGHIRMDIVIGRARGRTLWVMESIGVAAMLVLSMLLTWGSWLHFKRAFDFGDSSIDIDIPLWPAKLLVPLALSFLSARLMLQLWGYGRAAVTGEDRPVAVPLIETAAEQAQHEAETVSGFAEDESSEGVGRGHH